MNKILFIVVLIFGLAVSLVSRAGNETITAIKGIRVGHVTDKESLKGLTVIRFPKEGATAGVDVRGSAPGTCETDLLAPVNLVDKVNAIVLSGGSAYGIHSAGGVMKCLEEEGLGLDTGGILVPIVPAAVIFDLSVGSSSIRPTAEWGYKACKEATDEPVKEGNFGAGTGATVGKMFGMRKAMKGGLGSYSVNLPGGVVVAALAAVNTVGDVIDPDNGKIIAGTRGRQKGEFEDSAKLLRENASVTIFPGRNTTIGVVATNAQFNKTELTKIAQMAHDGLARAIRPAHTMYDGDTIFAASVPNRSVKGRPSVTTVGSVAADAFAEAVLRAIENAEGIEGYPSSKEWVR